MLGCNRSALLSTVICWIALSGAGCGRSETPGAGQAKPASVPAAAGTATPATKGPRAESTEWIEASRSWPDTLRWDFDSAAEHRQNGLLLRLEIKAAKNMIPGQYNDTKPLQCMLHMTMRPVPQWPLARGLVVDSVVFQDPLRRTTFPALPMMPAERTYESETVRATFANIMKKPYTPTVTERQPLKPILYLHWDKRLIVATLAPIAVEFLRSEDK